jgi:hypothetical protein
MNREFIDDCISNALNSKSNITHNILNLHGMCGNLTRHLYNNLCKYPNVNYLEIGCWKGASTISSLYKNEHVNATIIDNWSDFSNARFDFSKNISKHLTLSQVNNLQLINKNCFHLQSKLNYSPYNIFIYDASHDPTSQKLAITRFWEYLDKSCIIIIDDWCWDSVQKGTMLGLQEVNANIIYHTEIIEPLGENGFWNGCGIFLIEK